MLSPGRILEQSAASFFAVFDRIVPAANKYMATLWNGATGRKVVVQRVWSYNWQLAAAVGLELDQQLFRISARTAGTGITPLALDTSDTLTAGIEADTNSTVVTDVAMYGRVLASNDNVTSSDNSVMTAQRVLNQHALVYHRFPGTRGIVLRLNQGLSIKNTTVSVAGTVSYVFEFTDEEA